MITGFLTAGYTVSNSASDAIAAGLEAAFTLVAILWAIGIVMLIGIVALITWVVKKVWYAGSNREYKRQQKEWKRQQKQWRKFQQQQEWEEHQKQTAKAAQRSSTSTEDKFVHNPDWKWDDKAQLWRHKSQWDKIEQ
ncbi:MAG: hypothetical protein IJZ39_02705 [Oscillospiraceae bacterium]|nr:hypothetical protein [Oscillospiraceae bacterium]